MKVCLSLPSLGWKYFNSLGTEEDEPINNYNDKYLRWFVRQIIKGGRVCAFNQYFKSKICVDVLKIISEELNVKGNIYDITEAYLNYKNKRFKLYEKEHENQFNDYRDEDEEEKENFISLMIHYGVMMVEVYIQVLCGMRIVYILRLKQDTLLHQK